ncbi:hypothetical protein F5Y12DRAFT_151376 [Xylaria sp. FL1777]|nr:hypothetical protein F5Y12DRAFT_151376 [Xylaria sp. FL1777]
MEWRKHPTPENHHGLHTPYVDWKCDGAWSWPFEKLSYPHPDVLWGSLHAQFNCMPFAIQDPYAWHSDVCELAQASDTKEEFESALRKRRDERFNEIRANWEKTRSQLAANPIIWKAPPTGPDRPWATFCRIGRHFSFDTIMGHFGNYMVDDPDALYRADIEAGNAKASTAANEAPASSSAPPAPSRQTKQPTLLDVTAPSAPSPSPPSPPLPPPPAAAAAADTTSDTKTKQARVTRTSKGPVRRSRVEKPPPGQRTSKAKSGGGLRRSARLQERAGRGSR